MSELLATRPVGDRAVLVEVADNGTAQLLARAAREYWGKQVSDVVPGHRTVLLSWWGEAPSTTEVANVSSSLIGVGRGPSEAAATTVVAEDAIMISAAQEAIAIPIAYDGPDFDAVAVAVGVNRDRLIELHSTPEYTVAFIGFVPGFPYLIGGDPLLDLPRLSVPRTEVPAGSVAIAAGYCGIYPGASPGGWNLLGTTDAVLFDLDCEQPALLTPGARVRFRPR